jgi:hypothetical protein
VLAIYASRKPAERVRRNEVRRTVEHNEIVYYFGMCVSSSKRFIVTVMVETRVMEDAAIKIQQRPFHRARVRTSGTKNFEHPGLSGGPLSLAGYPLFPGHTHYFRSDGLLTALALPLSTSTPTCTATMLPGIYIKLSLPSSALDFFSFICNERPEGCKRFV